MPEHPEPVAYASGSFSFLRTDRTAIDSNPQTWQLARGRTLTLDRPRVVYILNVTPDSFSDGGELTTPEACAQAAIRARDDGADMLDVGGESTRPGAERIDAEQQLARVVPAITAIRRAGVELPISIDTTLAPVARAALEAGADAINDVAAGTEDGTMLALAAETGAGFILMHRARPPGEDSFSDRYERQPESPDIVREVRDFLNARMQAARAAGVSPEQIVLDPGLGFGKSVEQNCELVRRTPELCALGCPVMSAASRKSFVGRVSLGRDSDPAERLAGSIAFSVAHLAAGARLFRVHDARPHAESLRAAWAITHA